MSAAAPWDEGTPNPPALVSRAERLAAQERHVAAQWEQRRRLMARAILLAQQLTLTDDERRELAMMLPTRSGATGPVSWGSLSPGELARIVKWLEGAGFVLELLGLRA